MASASCSDDLAIGFYAFSPEDSHVNIYVSNIAFNATTHDLRQLFEAYGVVDKVNIITDRDTGQSRGFGFIEMPDSAAAKAAIQGVQGKEWSGRTLTVNEAKPREPRREPRQARW
jgi:RNA recognition motif-containing protein